MADRRRVSGARLHGLLNAELIHRDPNCDASFAAPKRIAPTRGGCNWKVPATPGAPAYVRLMDQIMTEFKQRYEIG